MRVVAVVTAVLVVLLEPTTGFVPAARVGPRSSTRRAAWIPAADLAGTVETLSVQTAVVVVHELGHLAAAKAYGMQVESFNVGVGPALLRGRAWGGVEVNVRALPFGGFVAFPRSYNATIDGVYTTFDDPDLLENRPLGQQVVVASAGVLANLALAWLCLFGAIEASGLPQPVYADGARVASVVADGPAAASAIQAGDVIVEMEGLPDTVPSQEEGVQAVIRDTRARVNQPTRLTLLRAPELQPRTVVVTPGPQAGNADRGTLGIRLVPNVVRQQRVAPRGLGEATQWASAEFWRILSGTWAGLVSNVAPLVDRNAPAPEATIVGPVGLLKMGMDIIAGEASDGAAAAFAATLSIDLALANALPLPVLDGGRVAILAVEAARGKKLSLRLKEDLSALAVLGLLAFVVSQTVVDVGSGGSGR